MSVLPYLIILVLLGLAVGWLAPRLFGGPDRVGDQRITLVGGCAAFIAGLFCWYVLNRHGWGMVISVVFSMLVVWLYRRSRPVAYGASRPTQYGGSRPAEYRGSRPAQYRGRAPGNRRPPS